MSRQSTVVDILSNPLNETKPMFLDRKTRRVRRASSTEVKPNGNSGLRDGSEVEAASLVQSICGSDCTGSCEEGDRTSS